MLTTNICAYCGKSFTYERKGAQRKYCSLFCQRNVTQKNYNDSHKGKLSNHNHKGYLSKALISLYEGKCAICGWRATEELIKTDKGIEYAHGNEIHHIKPVRGGGAADFDNLILLCPNHHKQADMGIIDPDTLKTYLKQPPTEEEQQEMSNRSIERVAEAIFKNNCE